MDGLMLAAGKAAVVGKVVAQVVPGVVAEGAEVAEMVAEVAEMVAAVEAVFGVVVGVAASGKRAVSWLKEHPEFDIVIDRI